MDELKKVEQKLNICYSIIILLVSLILILFYFFIPIRKNLEVYESNFYGAVEQADESCRNRVTADTYESCFKSHFANSYEEKYMTLFEITHDLYKGK